MGKLADLFYRWKESKRFLGKGESDLDNISKLIPNREAWEKRKEIIRNGILRGANLDPLPEKTPLHPVIHSSREYEGYKVENVYFESIPGFYVTGSLYQPLDPPKSLPLLLKPHGHLKNKRYKEDNQTLSAMFARMGVRVFTWDMIGYADSTQVKHKISSACTLQTWNSTRSLDFLLSSPKGDPERLGMTGGSGGGTQTFLLTAIDERVKFSAPTVMVSSFFFGGCVCESGLPIHKGKEYKTNNAEIAAMAAPRPMLITSVGTDWTRFVPKVEFPFIKNIYCFYDAEDKVENAHFPDETHNYGPSKRQAAYEFFGKYFNLNLDRFRNSDGKIDESPITLEPVSKLKVFNEEHPRPENALESEENILKTLKSLQK